MNASDVELPAQLERGEADADDVYDDCADCRDDFELRWIVDIAYEEAAWRGRSARVNRLRQPRNAHPYGVLYPSMTTMKRMKAATMTKSNAPKNARTIGLFSHTLTHLSMNVA